MASQLGAVLDRGPPRLDLDIAPPLLEVMAELAAQGQGVVLFSKNCVGPSIFLGLMSLSEPMKAVEKKILMFVDRYCDIDTLTNTFLFFQRV